MRKAPDDFVAMTARTFGVDNPGTVAQFRTGTGASNTYPVVAPPVINEIHDHPPDINALDNTLDEFIEMLHPSASPVPLFDPAFPTNSWRLRDAVTFDFPTNVTIAANGCLLVASFDPATNATLIVLVPPISILPSGMTFSAPGQFTLNFMGDVGAAFAVETSTNLVNWTQAGTVTNLTGSARFDHSAAGDAPARFYRLRLLPQGVARTSKSAVSRVSKPAAAAKVERRLVFPRAADLEIGDTAGLETCATLAHPPFFPWRSRRRE